MSEKIPISKCKFCGWTGAIGTVWENTKTGQHGHRYIPTKMCPQCEREGLELI